MKITRLGHTQPIENQRAVREALAGRRVVHCGMAEFAPGVVAHDGEPHRHAHDEVFIILAGEITVPIAGGPSGTAQAGDWVLVEAGEEHHLTNHTNLPCVAMYLIVEEAPE